MLGLAALVGVVAASLFVLNGCEIKIKWSCKQTTTNSMQCTFTNLGNVAGKACFDVVQVCEAGEHTARVCSGIIKAGGMENKVVRSFEPPVGQRETCMGTEFRNKVITPE
jgi:hypothetical protein